MKRTHLLGLDLTKIPADIWSSSACEILIMERWAQERPREAAFVSAELPDLPRHVWLASSGTLAQIGESKWIAVAKSALLASAEAVNRHLAIQRQESWGLTLPLAHVGGLGIVARAHLLDQKITLPAPTRWDPQLLRHWQGQLLSLVPTQVHDLVTQAIPAPASLRVVVVGGDRLASTLLAQGRALGWPLFPSYGLTECCSQVATALPGDDGVATLLPHIQAHIDPEGRLVLNSEALFTGSALVTHDRVDYQERPAGPWRTDDLAELNGTKLRILGRSDAVVKIRGEKVDVPQLESQLQLKFGELVLLAIPHPRDGHELWAISEHALELAELNLGLLPHQKVRGVKLLPQLPRNSLGKIKRGELRELLQKQV